MTQQEQARLKLMNMVLEGKIRVGEAAISLGLSERQGWRILKAYREGRRPGYDSREPQSAAS